MDKLEYINKRIKEMNIGVTVAVRKEIKELAKVLQEGEKLLYAMPGVSLKESWLIACTDKRILLLNKELFSLKQKEIPLNRITSIEQSSGMVFGKIVISDGPSKIGIENLAKLNIPILVETINNAVSDFNNSGTQTSSTDMAKQLQDLASLRDQEILTEEEFKQQKTKLLNS